MVHLLPTEMDKAYTEQLVNMLSTAVAVVVTKPEGGKRRWLSRTTQSDFVGILQKESRVVSEEEYKKNVTMLEGE